MALAGVWAAIVLLIEVAVEILAEPLVVAAVACFFAVGFLLFRNLKAWRSPSSAGRWRILHFFVSGTLLHAVPLPLLALVVLRGTSGLSSTSDATVELALLGAITSYAIGLVHTRRFLVRPGTSPADLALIQLQCALFLLTCPLLAEFGPDPSDLAAPWTEALLLGLGLGLAVCLAAVLGVAVLSNPARRT